MHNINIPPSPPFPPPSRNNSDTSDFDAIYGVVKLGSQICLSHEQGNFILKQL